MLENLPATESATVVRRYAPPNQRNRSANRRKSADRTNSAGNDLEKNQTVSSRTHGDVGGGWTAAIQSYNNPKDSSEKPVMYSGGTSSVWTQFRLPHQIMSPAGSASSSTSQQDFLAELRRQMQSANPGFST